MKAKPCPSCGSKDIHLFACPKYDSKKDNVEQIVDYSIKWETKYREEFVQKFGNLKVIGWSDVEKLIERVHAEARQERNEEIKDWVQESVSFKTDTHSELVVYLKDLLTYLNKNGVTYKKLGEK